LSISLRDIKRSLTEQTIVEKALALFKERGFDHVSVRQIAKAALVSEKTVFNYFPYKELIVVAGMQPALTAFMDEIQRQIDAIAHATEVLRNFGLNLAELCTANPEAAAIVVGELLTQDAQRQVSALRYTPDFYGPLRTVITLARAQGQLRAEVSVEYATDFFLSSVLHVIRTHLTAGHIERVRPMLAVMLEIFLHGAFVVAGDSQGQQSLHSVYPGTNPQPASADSAGAVTILADDRPQGENA
jgi:AcrR family transcriptional regulator